MPPHSHWTFIQFAAWISQCCQKLGETKMKAFSGEICCVTRLVQVHHRGEVWSHFQFRDKQHVAVRWRDTEHQRHRRPQTTQGMMVVCAFYMNSGIKLWCILWFYFCILKGLQCLQKWVFRKRFCVCVSVEFCMGPGIWIAWVIHLHSEYWAKTVRISLQTYITPFMHFTTSLERKK